MTTPTDERVERLARSLMDEFRPHYRMATGVNLDDWDAAVPRVREMWLAVARRAVELLGTPSSQSFIDAAKALRERLPNLFLHRQMDNITSAECSTFDAELAKLGSSPAPAVSVPDHEHEGYASHLTTLSNRMVELSERLDETRATGAGLEGVIKLAKRVEALESRLGERCRLCQGKGRVGSDTCALCHGRGSVEVFIAAPTSKADELLREVVEAFENYGTGKPAWDALDAARAHVEKNKVEGGPHVDRQTSETRTESTATSSPKPSRPRYQGRHTSPGSEGQSSVGADSPSAPSATAETVCDVCGMGASLHVVNSRLWRSGLCPMTQSDFARREVEAQGKASADCVCGHPIEEHSALVFQHMPNADGSLHQNWSCHAPEGCGCTQPQIVAPASARTQATAPPPTTGERDIPSWVPSVHELRCARDDKRYAFDIEAHAHANDAAEVAGLRRIRRLIAQRAPVTAPQALPSAAYFATEPLIAMADAINLVGDVAAGLDQSSEKSKARARMVLERLRDAHGKLADAHAAAQRSPLAPEAKGEGTVDK